MSNRIHIALLADCLENFAGGAEKQIYELAKGLNKSKYRVSVISLDCQGRASREAIEAIGCEFFVFRISRIYGLSGFIQGRRFFQYLKQSHVDILQTYHFSSDIWGTFWAHLAGVKKIVSNRRDMGFWRKGLHVQAYCLINPWVTKIVAVANSVKEMIVESEKVSEHKIAVIYNGIEQSSAFSSQLSAASLKEQLGISERDTVIAHVANLKPVKGHSFLLQAMAGVVKEFSNVKLFLVGKDEMNGELQRLAGELNIQDNVIFLGRRDDVPTILALSYFCVLTSLSEGMSNAILEYMLAGKAVVATRVGGNSELVSHGTNGLLVEKEDAEGLKNAIVQLLRSPAEASRMGENGFKRVESEFSMAGMVRKYENFFESLVHGRKKVLHFISSGGLYGAENVLLSLAGELKRTPDIVPVVGALKDSRDPHLEVIERAKEMGIETVIFESEGRFDIGAVCALKKYIRENKILLLHTHNYKSDIIGLLAAKLAGIPAVATAHGFTDMTHSVTAYEKLDRFLLRFFNKVVVVTDKILNGLDVQKRRVIANGLDIAKFSGREKARTEFRRQFGIRDDAFVIGTVGRLSREKNQIMLLGAALKMKQHGNVKYVIVGEGPEGKELRRFVRENGLDEKIIFTGLLKDTHKVYPALDIFTLTSTTEGVPLTILEAMAAGCPVVATRVGGIPEILEDGKLGSLADPEDIAGLAAKFELLMSDSYKRLQLAEQAGRFVRQNFSLERMSKAYLDVYHEVIAL